VLLEAMSFGHGVSANLQIKEELTQNVLAENEHCDVRWETLAINGYNPSS